MSTEKFIFSLDYEFDLLRFTVCDRDGSSALELYDPLYFTSLHYGVIADALKKYHKKRKKIPGATILKEEVLDLFKTRDYLNALDPTDKDTILKTIPTLFVPPRDGDIILEKCLKWAAYVNMKREIESVDLFNFEQYTNFSNKVLKAINIGLPNQKSKGTMLIDGIHERQFRRQDDSPIVPTPFRQINNLTNAGGYVKGSTIVILDKPKAAKTMALMNVARGYLKMRKNVFIADLENGEDELSLRFEQGIARVDKREILSGDHDEKVQRVLRKYRRLGGDVFIKRYPAMSNIYDFQEDMDRIYRDTGRRFQILLVDYVGNMASTTKKQDDFGRISDAYLDISNFALKNQIEHVWTPHHVTRDAKKREASKYTENDIAKCIDIIRHVQAVFGLNRNDFELEQGIMRMELVVQRDGQPWGRALFHSDPKIQRIDEYNGKEVKEYEGIMRDQLEKMNVTSDQFQGDV